MGKSKQVFGVISIFKFNFSQIPVSRFHSITSQSHLEGKYNKMRSTQVFGVWTQLSVDYVIEA